MRLNEKQLEILLGLISPFNAWLDANGRWWIVPENGPPGTGMTFLEAIGRIADAWKNEDDPPGDPATFP